MNWRERLEQRDLMGPVQRIARAHHVTLDEVMGRDRHAHVVRARHACWNHLRDEGWSYPAIARLWACDHSTVMSGVAKAVTRELADPRLALARVLSGAA